MAAAGAEWRTDVVWSQRCGDLQAGGGLHRPALQRRQARRPSGLATQQIAPRDQSQNRQDAQDSASAVAAVARRRGDPVKELTYVPESPSLWSLLQTRVLAQSAILTRRPPAQARRRERAAIAETRRRAARRGSVRDSSRTAASRACREVRALPVSGVSKAGLNVLGCQIREIGKNLLRRHSGCEVLQHVIDRYPHPTDGRFAATFPRATAIECPPRSGAALFL